MNADVTADFRRQISFGENQRGNLRPAARHRIDFYAHSREN
jgi:hypothetical protein